MAKVSAKSSKARRTAHRVQVQPNVKRTRIRKKEVKKEITIISRRSQPKWQVTAEVAALDKGISFEGNVSSSWISALSWDAERQVALMYLLDGKLYVAKIPFSLFEGWYYAHSKGTYWHEMGLNNYKWKRIR